jgi:hypothetical protein
MQGILNQNMARPDAQDEITPEQVRKDMKLPPELQNAYERVVVAGMKMMFSKETSKYMLQQLEAPGPMAEKLGNGVAELMIALFMQSNKTMPPQVIIPAGTELVVQAADFIKKSGLAEVTNRDIGDGVQIMMSQVFRQFGIDPDQLFQKIGQFDPSQIEQMAQQDQMAQQMPQGQGPVAGV